MKRREVLDSIEYVDAQLISEAENMLRRRKKVFFSNGVPRQLVCVWYLQEHSV